MLKKLIHKLLLGTVNKRISNLEQKAWLNEIALITFFKSQKFSQNPNAGFNEQHYRKEIFNELHSIFKFENIVETGTFTGNTTEYLANTTEIPIYSAEINELFYCLAENRLAGFEHVKLFNLDSVSMLKSMTNNKALTDKQTFFYLDAHWYDNLPLAEEIEIISKKYSHYVIMIDDFKVEGDSGYIFDDYGTGKSLTLECFGEVIENNGLECYFPICHSSSETGSKTGSIVLFKRNESPACMSKVTKLRKHN